MNGLRSRGRAGEDDAGDLRMRDERGADRAIAGNILQSLARHAGLEQKCDGLLRDERRLLGRLGHSGVAGDERRRDLAEKNRQRKIPRRDADEHAAPAPAQAIGLSRRAGQRLLRAEQPRLPRIIAAEIDGLAQFRKRIVERLAALLLQQRDKPTAPRLDEIGRALDNRRARFERRRLPCRKGARRRRHRGARRIRIGLCHRAYARIVDRRAQFARRDAAVSGGRRRRRNGRMCGVALREQCGDGFAVAEFDAFGIGAERTIEIGRRRQPRMPRARGLADDRAWWREQFAFRRRGVGGARDEGGIGAILDEPPHQIGEQIAMRADRRIDAAACACLLGEQRLE